jgi:hypothetical protein
MIQSSLSSARRITSRIMSSLVGPRPATTIPSQPRRSLLPCNPSAVILPLHAKLTPAASQNNLRVFRQTLGGINLPGRLVKQDHLGFRLGHGSSMLTGWMIAGQRAGETIPRNLLALHGLKSKAEGFSHRTGPRPRHARIVSAYSLRKSPRCAVSGFFSAPCADPCFQHGRDGGMVLFRSNKG